MRRLIAVALVLAGCTQSGTGVLLTVDAPGIAPNLLTLIASWDTRVVPRTVELPGGLPTTVLAELPDEDTTITFDVTAKDGAVILAHGKTPDIPVKAHQIAAAMITIGANNGGDGGGGGGDGGDDGGSTVTSWTPKQGGEPLAPGTITGLWGSSGGDVYATSTLAGAVNLLRSTNHGATWQGQLAGSVVSLRAVTGSSDSDVYLVGDNSTILHGSGTTWTSQTSPAPAGTNFFGVFEVAPGDAYVVGSGNVAMHNSGSNWLVQTSLGTTELRAVWGVSGNVWAVGGGGVILHKTGTGAWMPETSGTTATLNGIYGLSATDIYAVGDGAVVLHSTGNGMWAPASTGIDSAVSLSAVTAAPGGTLFVAGSSWSIYRLSGGIFIAEPTNLAVADPSQDRLFALFAPSAVEAFAGGAGRTLLHRP